MSSTQHTQHTVYCVPYTYVYTYNIVYYIVLCRAQILCSYLYIYPVLRNFVLTLQPERGACAVLCLSVLCPVQTPCSPNTRTPPDRVSSCAKYFLVVRSTGEEKENNYYKYYQRQNKRNNNFFKKKQHFTQPTTVRCTKLVRTRSVLTTTNHADSPLLRKASPCPFPLPPDWTALI